MEKLCTRYGKSKVYILSIILTFIISLGVSGVTQYLSHTFQWEGQTFRLIKQTRQTATFKDRHGNPLDITIEPGQLNNYFLRLHLSYLDKTITYDSLDFDKGIIITLSDASIYQEDFFSLQANSSFSEIPSQHPEVILVEKVLQVMQNSLSPGTLILFSCITLGLLLLGFMGIIYPEVSWKIKYALDVDGGEPSDFYITTTKLGGYVLIGLALIFPFLYLLSTKS